MTFADFTNTQIVSFAAWVVVALICFVLVGRTILRQRKDSSLRGADATATNEFEDASNQMAAKYQNMPEPIATQQRKDKRRATQVGALLVVLAVVAFVGRACVRAHQTADTEVQSSHR